MKKELLIRLIIIVLTILILLGFLSYFSFLIKKSNNKTYKIQKFSEEKCDDKYCIYNLSVKYIDKKRSYYKLKGIVYYKSEEVIDKYCIKITLLSKKDSELLKKCYEAGSSNFFTGLDEVIISDKYRLFDDIKIEKMTDEEIKQYYMYE